MMRFRFLNRLRAHLGGYFWCPCDNCGRYFGGHEKGWKPRNIGRGDPLLICPGCMAVAEFFDQALDDIQRAYSDATDALIARYLGEDQQ